MPKSKRSKIVHTSVVQKKPSKEKSTALYAAVQEASERYQRVFVFGVANMRNNYLKEVRQEFADSRLFFGKTKVMAKALDTSADDEHMPGLSGLTGHLRGSVGLLFTDRAAADVIEYFANYSEVDFARAGMAATRTFTVPAGVVHSRGGEVPAEEDVPLPHSLEVTVRKWGMPTKLDKGKVVLDGDYTVCKEGRELNSHQSALLKLFGIATAEFRVRIAAYWDAATQDVTEVEGLDDEVMEE